MLTAIGLALALAQPAQPAAAPVERRIQAPEARQGIASDGSFVYAVDNQRLGKYAISTGRRVASWSGDPK